MKTEVFSLHKRDLIVILSILLLSVIALLVFRLTAKNGGGVTVRVDGEIIAVYSFADEGKYELNGGTNILVIEDGKAYLIDADCPDKLCVKQGRISREGQTITCLPNKLTVTVYGVKNIVEI